MELTFQLNILINRAITNQVLDDKEVKFLSHLDTYGRYFHHLPRIHKNIYNPPGRPASSIASMNSLTNDLFQYIDIVLQPVVISLPSYVKHSGHLIHILNNYAWEPTYACLSLDPGVHYTPQFSECCKPSLIQIH